jgi:hypothetical protein
MYKVIRKSLVFTNSKILLHHKPIYKFEIDLSNINEYDKIKCDDKIINMLPHLLFEVYDCKSILICHNGFNILKIDNTSMIKKDKMALLDLINIFLD